MSGGAFEYQCMKDLDSHAGGLDALANALERLGRGHAAARTRQAAEHLRAAETTRLEMRDVWCAVEWVASGDYSPGDEVDAVRAWLRTTTGEP